MANIIQIPNAAGLSFEENFKNYGLEKFRESHPGVVLLLKGDKRVTSFDGDREIVGSVAGVPNPFNEDLPDVILKLKAAGHKVAVISKSRDKGALKIDDQQNPGDMVPEVFKNELDRVAPEAEAIVDNTEESEMQIGDVNEGLTKRKKMEIHQKSQAMLADGVSFGIKRNLYTAVGLWNIKHHETYKLEGFNSWQDYCEAIGITRTATYKFLQIGDALHIAFENKGLLGNPEAFSFQKSDLEAHCRHGLEHLKTVPLRELNALAKDIDTFERALLGDGSEEHKQFTQLLLEAPKSDKEQIKDKAVVDEEKEFHKYMRDICKANGWKWDAKNRQCLDKDGGPLTQTQLAQIETPDSASRVWVQIVERLVVNFERQLHAAIDVHGPNYVRYRIIPNDSLSQSIAAMRKRFSNILTQCDLMVEYLHGGELERVNELHRRGMEDAAHE